MPTQNSFEADLELLNQEFGGQLDIKDVSEDEDEDIKALQEEFGGGLSVSPISEDTAVINKFEAQGPQINPFDEGGKFGQDFFTIPSQKERTERFRNAPGGAFYGGALTKNEEAPLTAQESEELLAREEFAVREQVGQDKDLRLDESEIDPATIFLMARENKAENKRAIFEEKYPDLQLKVFKTRYGDEMFYETPDGKVRPVNARGASIQDIGEYAPILANEDVATSLAAGVATGGAGFLVRSGAQIAAGAVAPFLKNEAQKAAGSPGMTDEELTQESVIGGSIGFGGELGGAFLARLMNRGRGAGLLDTSQGVKKAQQFALENGLTPLSPDQMNIFLQRKVAQIKQLDTKQVIDEYKDRQANDLKLFLQDMQKAYKEDDVLIDDTIRKTYQDMTVEVMDQIANPMVNLTEGGEALVKGLKQYKTESQKYFDLEYGNIRRMPNIDQVKYDIRGAKKEAADQLQEILEVGEASPSFKQQKALENLLKQPDIMTGIDDIRKFRKQFFDLGDSSAIVRDASHGRAQRIAKSLHSSFRNPIDGPKDVVEALDRVNNDYSSFLQINDMESANKIFNSQSPERLVKELARPENSTQLAYLKSVLPEENWVKFTDAFQTRLQRDPSSIIDKLDEFVEDPETLDLLLSPQDQINYRLVGDQIRKIDNSVIGDYLNNLNDKTKVFKDLVKSSEKAQVNKILETGGPSLKTGLQYGVMSDLLESSQKSSKINPTEMVIDSAKLVKNIEELDANGTLSFLFSPEEINRIKDLKSYAFFTKTIDDTGANLQAQEIVGKTALVSAIRHPIQALSAVTHVRVGNPIEASIFMSDWMRDNIFGKEGITRKQFNGVRTLVTTMAQGANNLNRLAQETEWPDELKGGDNETISGSSGNPDVGGGSGDDLLGEVQNALSNNELDNIRGKGVSKTPIDQLPEEFQSMAGESMLGITSDQGYEFIPNVAEQMIEEDSSQAFLDKFDQQLTESSLSSEKGLWDLVPNLLTSMKDGMSRDKFIESIIDNTVKLEGGYVNDPDDDGGPTKFGITLGTLQDVNPSATINDVKNLTKDEAKDIYLESYYYKPKVDELPKDLQDLVFDMNVLHGPGNSGKIVQRALNDIGVETAIDGIIGSKTLAAIQEADSKELREKINDRRERFVRWIAKNKPEKKKFLNGWINRVNEFRDNNNV